MEVQPEKTTKDLTVFFLEWRDKCAIDKCERMDDVHYVHAMFDAKLRTMISQVRRSRFMGGTIALSEYAGKHIHAFHLIESEFYRSSDGQNKDREKRYGAALKSHLFESESSKADPGRLNGYFLDMLRTVVKESFKNSVVRSGGVLRDKDGEEVEPLNYVSSDNLQSNTDHVSTDVPDQGMDVDTCLTEFHTRFKAMWETLGTAERLALLCEIFDISKNRREIVAASGLGQSAFYNRHPIGKVREIADAMLESYDLDVLMHIVRNFIAKMAYDLGEKDPNCSSVTTIIEQEGLASKADN
jgi:hypothetical protein